MRKPFVTLALLAFTILLITGVTRAESPGQVAFLTVKIDSESVTLLDSRIVDGTAKSRRAVSREIGLRYEVISDKSEIIAYDIIENPLIRHLEYEDPDNPGRILSKNIILEEATVTIRVKLEDSFDKLEFYNVAPSPDKRGTERSSLGAISLSDLRKGVNHD